MSQDAISLQVEPREVTGKAVKQLRRDGLVPAVIHDHGKPSVVVQGDAQAMLKVYVQAGKHHPINLKAGGKSYTAMIKTAEFEPKKHRLNHLVFNAISATQKVEADIPVHARYDEGNESSPAERNGLMVLTHLDTVAVEAVASKLPDVLYYNAETLVEIGDHVSVSDLEVPADVELKTEPNQSIASVYEPSAVAAANDAAGGDADAEAADVAAEQGGEAQTEADSGDSAEKSDEA